MLSDTTGLRNMKIAQQGVETDRARMPIGVALAPQLHEDRLGDLLISFTRECGHFRYRPLAQCSQCWWAAETRMLQGYALLLNITLRTDSQWRLCYIISQCISFYVLRYIMLCTVFYGPMLCACYYVFVLCCIHDLFRIVIYCIIILLNIESCVVQGSTDLRPFVYCNTSR